MLPTCCTVYKHITRTLPIPRQWLWQLYVSISGLVIFWGGEVFLVCYITLWGGLEKCYTVYIFLKSTIFTLFDIWLMELTWRNGHAHIGVARIFHWGGPRNFHHWLRLPWTTLVTFRVANNRHWKYGTHKTKRRKHEVWSTEHDDRGYAPPQKIYVLK